MDSPIEVYLHALRRALRRNPLLARRVLEEVADHLAEAAAAGRRAGMDPREAEEDVVRRMGPADRLARQFDPFDLPLKVLLIVATLATVAVALWLFTVITFVLPSRDPGHIRMWLWIAIGFLAYSGLSAAYLVRGPRSAWLKWLVLASSLAAIGLGVFGVASMVRVANSGGHFEGYIVLMSVILCGHGLAAIGYTLVTARIVRAVRSA